MHLSVNIFQSTSLKILTLTPKHFNTKYVYKSCTIAMKRLCVTHKQLHYRLDVTNLLGFSCIPLTLKFLEYEVYRSIQKNIVKFYFHRSSDLSQIGLWIVYDLSFCEIL